MEEESRHIVTSKVQSDSIESKRHDLHMKRSKEKRKRR